MDQFTKKKYFIGIDISKDHLDVALLKAEELDVFREKKVDNSFTGFDAIQNWLIKQKVNFEDCLFCMEHTGTYGLLLFAWLSQLGIDYCVEPGIKIKRSLGIARGKNDKVDARRIADYAGTNRAKLIPFQMPSSLLLQIKQFLTYRDQQTKIKVSLKNSLKSHDQYQRVSGIQAISDDIQQQIVECDQRIERIDVQIIDLIRTDETLKKNFDLATSVKGIGLVIAAFMLVTTNNFTSFENGRKYACYTGIAPFENTSGKYRGKTRVSHLANKRVKTLLSNGANSARKWDPELRAYYARKIEEGKEHKLVINSIRCKMVNRVFAVVKRETPYVNTYQQKIA
jgi:transposase